MSRETEEITAWITKYALTNGIDIVRATVINDKMIKYGRIYAHGKDWHRTPEAAIEQANKMRIAKILSLKKQIAKLEGMVFTAPQKS